MATRDTILRLAAAADALYGTRTASSQQEVEAANVWLIAFSESAEAWGVCLALLAAEKDGLQEISQVNKRKCGALQAFD